MAVMKHI